MYLIVVQVKLETIEVIVSLFNTQHVQCTSFYVNNMHYSWSAPSMCKLISRINHMNASSSVIIGKQKENP